MVFPHGAFGTNIWRFATKIGRYIMLIFAMGSIGAFLSIRNEIALRFIRSWLWEYQFVVGCHFLFLRISLRSLDSM